MSTPLRELGYVEGQNLLIERKYAEGNFDRLPGLARDLVRLDVDVIFAVGVAPAKAAMDATTMIPIVWLGNLDPVAGGLVTNLARPGGNVTGGLDHPRGDIGSEEAGSAEGDSFGGDSDRAPCSGRLRHRDAAAGTGG
jgi:ABC-type uncharacterized transport system substrate-binding protein